MSSFINKGSSDSDPIQLLLPRLLNVLESNNGWTARCPGHDDSHNSLSVGVGQDGRVLLHCFAGCPVEKIVAALGLGMRDLFPVDRVRGKGMKVQKRPPITIDDLARDKGLPPEFLAKLGLRNCPRGVQVAYLLRGGTAAPRQRIRTALVAREGSFWTDGRGAIVPYGLERLQDARTVGFIVLVEGESDRWTLSYHGFPSLGIPGADMTGKLESEHLTGIQKIYVIREPDKGGATFIAGVAQRLHEIGWKGDSWCVVLPDAKDPNDLHKQNPDGFKQAFQRALDEAEPLPEPQEEPGKVESAALPIPYKQTANGLFWLRPTHIPVPLTNFTARIVADVAEDDGTEVRHALEIETSLKGQVRRFSVPGSQFAVMNWVLDQLGAGAIIYPGPAIKDNTRVAVQLISGDVPTRTVFQHLGWRKVEGTWVYLHAGGAIGANGSVTTVEVSVPEQLRAFVLPEPPSGEKLILAIRASLHLLDLAPLRVTAPPYAAIWRAVLGPADFSVHLAGKTGSGKTELAALQQQHFGAGMHSRNLPGSWQSTGNSLEALAFYAKDALLVIDDFAPAGSVTDVHRYHRDADRVMRAQGNNAGRQRMRSDATLKPPKPPRGLIVSTGEDVPRGQSLRARMLADELGPTDMDWKKLTLCQEDAAQGLYAQALAAYVRWLAPRYEEVRGNLRAQVANLRRKALQSSAHRRTPEILANLGIGLRYMVDFALEVAALTKAEADDMWENCWKALGEAAAEQIKHQTANDPVRRFLELLNSAVSSGHAHLAGPDGGEPSKPGAWGWREVSVGVGGNERTEWRPQGSRVGWVTVDGVFLEPNAAYGAAQDMGRKLGDNIALMPRTLHKRLHEHGLLVTTDESRQTLTVRRMFEGRRQEVLHLSPELFIPEPGELDQTTDSPQDFRAWAGLWSGQCQQTHHDISGASDHLRADGQVGQVLRHGRDNIPESPIGSAPREPRTGENLSLDLSFASPDDEPAKTSGERIVPEPDQPDRSDQTGDVREEEISGEDVI